MNHAHERREGAGGRIVEVTKRREQHRQQDMDPLIGLALAHPEQAALDDLQTIRLQICEQKEQSMAWFKGGLHAKAG